MQLTLAEFNRGYSLTVREFRKSQTDGWAEALYKVNKQYNLQRAKELFLYCYALSTWDHDETAENVLTEQMVIAIINKASEL